MFSKMRMLLQLPVFDNQEKTRIARILHVILLTLLVASILTGIINLVEVNLEPAYVLLFGSVLVMVLLGVARRGYIRAASFITLLIFVGIETYILFQGAGIHDTAMMLYPCIAVMSSLLLDRRACAVLMVLCGLSVGAVIYGEMNGFIVTEFSALTSIYDFFTISIILAITAVTTRILSDDLARNVARAISNERVLAEINRQLERQAEELAASGRFTNDIMAATPGSVYIYDLVAGQITFVNRNIVDLLGYTPDEIQAIGDDLFAKLIHPDDFQHVPSLLERWATASDEDILTAQYRMKTASGEWRWLTARDKVFNRNQDGSVEQIIGIVYDITDSKWVEESIKQYSARLEILHEIDQAILGVQSPQAIAQAVLNRIQDLLPCKRASVSIFDYQTGQAIVLAVHVNGETQLGKGVKIKLEEFGIDENLRQGEISSNEDLQELPEISPVRQRLLLEGIRSIVNIPLTVREELIGTLNLGADRPQAFGEEQIEVARELADVLAVAVQQARLHEQVQHHAEELEERVAERTAELEAKNRELETFTYSVSHDLKAPLRGIDGYNRLLLESYSDQLDEEGQNFLDLIRRATDQMNQLIDDLLAYSRLERRTLVKGKVYIPGLLDAILAERKVECDDRHVELVIDVPYQYAIAEAEGLTQALRNLLDNALKFTRQVSNPSIEIGGRETDTAYQLWVRDNGIGFDPKHHDRIFEIFQRLHHVEDYPGTGVGLALVRKVVQRMGGHVWAESAPGGGATFYLEIPK